MNIMPVRNRYTSPYTKNKSNVSNFGFKGAQKAEINECVINLLKDKVIEVKVLPGIKDIAGVITSFGRNPWTESVQSINTLMIPNKYLRQVLPTHLGLQNLKMENFYGICLTKTDSYSNIENWNQINEVIIALVPKR